jgi:dihydroorotate dehydrogenase
MKDRLETRVGGLRLKNPVICGAGEHVMTRAGLEAGLAAGASVVAAKSFNESEAAKDQLDRTDYALLDSDFARLPWDFKPPRDASLACRSGLTRMPFAQWLEIVAELDRKASKEDAYVAANIILAGLDAAVDMAKQVEQAGVRLLEYNIGTPYGEEAGGAVTTERAADRVREIVAAIRAVVGIPIWVKITGQSESVASLVAAAHDGGANAVVLMGRFMGMFPDLETQAPLLGTNLGYGGAWSLPLTCYWLARTRKELGPEAQMVGINGARNGDDVLRMMLAGARAAQLSTAVFTAGFGVLNDAIEQMDAYLSRRGETASEIVGRAADRVGTFRDQPSRPGWWTEFIPPEAREV